MCALEYIDACPDICDTSRASAAGRGAGIKYIYKLRFRYTLRKEIVFIL